MTSTKESNIIEVPVETDWSQYKVSKKFQENILNIILVQLEPVQGSSGDSKRAILTSNDERMKLISAKLYQSFEKITFVYTAQDFSTVGLLC